MTVYLVGHSYEFAVVESAISLLGRVKVIHGNAPPDTAGDHVVSRLSDGVAHTYASLCGKTASTSVAVSGTVGADGDAAYERVGAEQHAVKKSLYLAISQLVGGTSWGAMSGMRPAKLAAKLIRAALLVHRDAAFTHAEKTLIRDYFVEPSKARLCVECARYGIALADSLDGADTAVYVGIPFCPTRCSYCSFVSRSTEFEGALTAPYLDALLREFERRADELSGDVVMAYIGGGTPTVLSAAQLDRLLGALTARVDTSRLREFTVEAGRPDTVSEEKLAVLRSYGVGRIAINPQSMDDAVLRAVGRNHSAADTAAAFNLARRMGFGNINMDLIAGLPTDTPHGFAATVDAVLALAPENITVHTLARKRGAAASESGVSFSEKFVDLHNDTSEKLCNSTGAVAEMVNYASERLRAAGYLPYYVYRQKYTAESLENVGWTLPGRECLYNIAAMEELCGIAAFGAGAISKYRDGKAVLRRSNKKYPLEYIADFT